MVRMGSCGARSWPCPAPWPGAWGCWGQLCCGYPQPLGCVASCVRCESPGVLAALLGPAPAPGNPCRGSRGWTCPCPLPPPALPCCRGTAGARVAAPPSSRPRAAGRAALRAETSQGAKGWVRALLPWPGAVEGHPLLPLPRGAAQRQRVPSPPLGPGRGGPCGAGACDSGGWHGPAGGGGHTGGCGGGPCGTGAGCG